MNVKCIVLTDINNTTSCFEFIQECKKKGIKPIIGIEFRSSRSELLYIGIAKNNDGWEELCRHLTMLDFGVDTLRGPKWENSYTIYRESPVALDLLYDHEYIGVRPEEVKRLEASNLSNHIDKLVILSPITFLDKEGFQVHKLLRCIDLNIVLSKLQKENHAKSTEVPIAISDLLYKYKDYPTIINNTKSLIDNCSIDIRTEKEYNRQSFTNSTNDDIKLLRKLVMQGLRDRYGYNDRARLRVQSELDIIDKLGYGTYFLITWDVIRYSRTKGYRHVGRGSGANSIVAYVLYITDVDPLELDLYFERFINPHRSSPPDFDIDFSWDERDDVTDYIFKRYGREHTALLATYNTFKGKSIIREMGKVLGLPKSSIDTIINEPTAKEKHHPYAKWIFKYGKKIEGFPNYLSIHAGGIIISEEPLYKHTALKMMPKGFPIVHFDMYGAEDLGYHKYDILSQRGLGHIKDTIDLVWQNTGKYIDIERVEEIKEDHNVKLRLKSGECIGCFYIESPAMRGLLTKLRCSDYKHLVAASSIIRPGVAKSGMMREYIHRFHNPDSYTYVHDVFEKHLGETYGVMVYQEDVMKIVHHFSGLGLDESDVLRRIMTGKRKNSDTFERLKLKYFKNCKERGYSEELSMEVWRQIASFSGYSFCKAHSASFAVESFQSLYLKTYYPLEFMTAVVNNFGGFYNTELYLHEARMCGADVVPPCINNSKRLTTIKGRVIYVGFMHVADLEKSVVVSILEERNVNGDYLSLRDFTNRVEITLEQLEILIRVGAFRFTGMSKYQLMWQKNNVHTAATRPIRNGIFGDDCEEYDIPNLMDGQYDQVFDEIELLGFPLSSPFELLRDQIHDDILAKDMNENEGKVVRMVGYYVAKKHVTTVNKKHMNFGTWLDREGKFFDTTHFPQALLRYPFKGRGCYLITGKIVLDFDFPSMDVVRMERLGYVTDTRFVVSDIDDDTNNKKKLEN